MRTQIITIEKIRGNYSINKTGDKNVINKFCIKSKDSQSIGIHAFADITTLLSAFLHGTSSLEFGVGSEEDMPYLQYPDSGPLYTKGGFSFQA